MIQAVHPLTSPRRGPAAGLARGQTRPIVLFGFSGGRPSASLRRARALARLLDGELHVVRAVPMRPRSNPLFPHLNVREAIEVVEATATARQATVSWLKSSLGPDEGALLDFEVVQADLVTALEERAPRLGPALIVIPPAETFDGAVATSLAEATGVPVLVARRPTRAETIIAATDMATPGFPVVRKAAELALRLEAPVVALHNVSPVAGMGGGDAPWPVVALPRAALRAACTERLAALSRALPAEVEGVVRGEVTPVGAILREARELEADLVVVGARPRSWLARWLTGDVAAEVVERAGRSVLVVPLYEAREDGARSSAPKSPARH